MGNFFTPVALSSVVALQPLTNLLTTNYSSNSTVWWSNYSRTSNNNHTTECGHQINNMYGKNYFALLLLIIPSLTILGNALVVMSIVREKALQTTTNYLILSLAVADFLVAFCVMPFAVYVEVSYKWIRRLGLQMKHIYYHRSQVEESVWNLPKFLCNVFIASDVWASTASILNLVAVSWDRYVRLLFRCETRFIYLCKIFFTRCMHTLIPRGCAFIDLTDNLFVFVLKFGKTSEIFVYQRFSNYLTDFWMFFTKRFIAFWKNID